MKKILVTGVGGSPAANFIRSIRTIKEKIVIIGTDSNEFYLNRSEADKSYLAPDCHHEKYIDFLNFLIGKHKLEFIHVQNDSEIEVVSFNREKLKINKFLPAKETIATCLDKHKANLIWKGNGIKVPDNFLIKSKEDLKRIYLKLNGKIWLREISGAGGKGSLAPKTLQQANSWINFKDGWGKFLAAELLSPDSITWMSIWKDGELVVAQSRKRLYWELAKISPSGITGATGAGMTISNSLVDEIAIKSIKSIDKKPHGIFSADLTYDFSGIPNPTEINIGRFFTTHEFFTRAGLNMPEIYLKLAYGQRIPKLARKINPLQENLVWIRGIDYLPVLIKKSKLEKDMKKLQKTLKRFY